MSKLKFIVAFSIVFVLVTTFFVLKGFALSDEDATRLAISRAEDVVALAYETVLEAEHVAVDVSDLLARLNDASEFLTAARVAFGLGDLDKAVRWANLGYDIGDEVKNNAYELWLEAYGVQTTGFWLTMIGSLASIAVVVVGSLLCWHSYKHHYYQRMLKMKPEAASNES